MEETTCIHNDTETSNTQRPETLAQRMYSNKNNLHSIMHITKPNKVTAVDLLTSGMTAKIYFATLRKPKPNTAEMTKTINSFTRYMYTLILHKT